jgi:4-amino-4-deoxy-L-arabinose transferase-like glycosyltransferase
MDAAHSREDSTPALWHRFRRDIFILCVATIALLAPFSGKPVHVDDPMYIWAAQQIVAHPLDFYGFNVNWGGHVEPMPATMINPPLLPYYLAAVSRLVGWSEIALHVVMLPFALLSEIALYLLARRFCRLALIAALLMLLCPAFCVSCTTLMCEVPMLCLWLWATYFWVRGSESQSYLLLISAGVIASLHC